MDLPKPPEDPDLKNIIDKLANFVSRNGIEFEKMTKEKQKNNSKFSFLFGGQYYSYYQFKLSTEQQIMNQQKAKMAAQGGSDSTALQSAPWQQQQQPQQQQQQIKPGFSNSPFGSQMQQAIPSQQMSVPPWKQQQQQSISKAPWQQQQGGASQHQAPLLPQPVSHGTPPPPLMMSKAIPTGLVKLEQELEKEEEEVEKQIQDSENNLLQQHQALMAQQEKQITIEIEKAENDFRLQSAADAEISLSAFDQVLQPIIESCTKDSIASGKTWILANSSSEKQCEVVARQVLWKVTSAVKQIDPSQAFTTQLHIIYLINDVLHHASRKNLSSLSRALENVIVPIFATTQTNANEEHQERLTKLLGLWSRFKYFSDQTMEDLGQPDIALKKYKENLRNTYAEVANKVKNSTNAQYQQYVRQNEEYAKHLKGQVEEKRRLLEIQKKTANQQKFADDNMERFQRGRDSYQDHDHQHMGGNEPPWSRNDDYGMEDESNLAYDFDQGRDSNINRHGYVPYSNNYRRGQQHQQQPSNWRNNNNSGRDDWHGNDAPDNWGPNGGGGQYGDQRGSWPPGRGPAPHRDGPAMGMPMDTEESAIIPKAPYFDLPAGLMAPLVKLEETDYKELDPTMIRLPAPVPPSERLLAAVEAFYSAPSHDRPRNPEGWEHNGLFEFFRAKMRAKRRLQQQDNPEKFSRSPSSSPPHRRAYPRSRSRSRSRSGSRSYSRSRSRSSSSRSRSSRSRSGSRSRSRSRSGSRSRSRSRSPDRAPTPPTFAAPQMPMQMQPPGASPGMMMMQQGGGGGGGDDRLDGGNRGAQMMRKMGWGGAGLGSNEQGIQDPVKAGDVRDKYDQFKGLGMEKNDPFENYRKNRSQGYVTRMRARGEGNGD